jgi:hypothetical protein
MFEQTEPTKTFFSIDQIVIKFVTYKTLLSKIFLGKTISYHIHTRSYLLFAHLVFESEAR